MLSTNVFKELCVKTTLLRSILNKFYGKGVCNAVCFRLCIDMPPVTAEEYDGSHHPRYAEWHCTQYVIQLTWILKSIFLNNPLKD